MYDKYHGKGIDFLGVNVDWDKPGDAERFVQEHRLPFPVGHDSGGWIGSLYKVDATPVTLFIDRTGRLVERHEGEMDKAQFEQRIQKLLAG